MKATLEVQKAVFLSVFVYVVTHFAKVGTVIVQSLHADHQQLVSIKIKFKLSSSQETSQCLLYLTQKA